MVLNLGLWWAEEMSRSEMSNPVKQILAISPATDLRNDNPQIAEADKRDPVLSVGLTTDVGKCKIAVPLEMLSDGCLR